MRTLVIVMTCIIGLVVMACTTMVCQGCGAGAVGPVSDPPVLPDNATPKEVAEWENYYGVHQTQHDKAIEYREGVLRRNQANVAAVRKEKAEKYWASNPKPLQPRGCDCQTDGCCDCDGDYGCECIPPPLHLDKDILRPNLPLPKNPHLIKKEKKVNDRLLEYRNFNITSDKRKTIIILMLIEELHEQDQRMELLENRLQQLEQRE